MDIIPEINDIQINTTDEDEFAAHINPSMESIGTFEKSLNVHTIRGISVGPNRGSIIPVVPIVTIIPIVNNNLSDIFKTIYFSLTYCLIFTGYYVSLTFVSIKYPNYSFIGFALLYTTYSIGSLLAPSIGGKLGVKNSIILSSFFYIFYIFTINIDNVILYLCASILTGFSAGLIWLHQGIWITKIAENNNTKTGLFQGIFYSIFNFNNIIGNILGLILLYVGISINDMLWYMMCVTGLGILMSFFISNLPTSVILSKDQLYSTFNKRLKAVINVAKIKEIRMLMPIMAYQSSGICLTFQILPKLIFKSSKFISDDKDLAGRFNMYAFLTYGISSSIFAFLWGRIFDRYGWKWIYIPLFSMEIICLIMYILFDHYKIHPYFWIFVASFRGIIDYGINSLLCCSISKYYIKQSTSIYGLYRCLYALFYIPISILTGIFEFQWIILLTLILMITSTMTYILFILHPKETVTNEIKPTEEFPIT